MRSVLILGNGNYFKCIVQNYSGARYYQFTKAGVRAVDRTDEDSIQSPVQRTTLGPYCPYFFDYVLCTYPAHVLDTRLPILQSIRFGALVHLATQGSVLESYQPYLREDTSFIFLGFGPWHTRDGVIRRKYRYIPALVTYCHDQQQHLDFLNHYFGWQLLPSSNKCQFVFNFHNQILHPVLLSMNKSRRFLYRYDLYHRFAFALRLWRVSNEMKAAHDACGGVLDWVEFGFYAVYMTMLSLFIPEVMSSVAFPTKLTHRFYAEDAHCLQYVLRRSPIHTPAIESVLRDVYVMQALEQDGIELTAGTNGSGPKRDSAYTLGGVSYANDGESESEMLHNE